MPCGEERYDCGIVVEVDDSRVVSTASLLDIWPKLASFMQNLRHVKKLSLKFEVAQDCWGWTTDFMVDIRPFMQDLYASLSPRQCLVVDPPNPPGLFENKEDFAQYPYLERKCVLSLFSCSNTSDADFSIRPYPELVIAAMEEERQNRVEERKERKERKKKEEEELMKRAEIANAKRKQRMRRCSRCNLVHEMKPRG